MTTSDSVHRSSAKCRIGHSANCAVSK